MIFKNILKIECYITVLTIKTAVSINRNYALREIYFDFNVTISCRERL
jgi:hypothetical protein